VLLSVAQLEAVLIGRLEAMLRHWLRLFEQSRKKSGRGKRNSGAEAPGAGTGSGAAGDGVSATPAGGDDSESMLRLTETVHVMVLRHNVMSLRPPLQQVCVSMLPP
jgi:hypothetical protein